MRLPASRLVPGWSPDCTPLLQAVTAFSWHLLQSLLGCNLPSSLLLAHPSPKQRCTLKAIARRVQGGGGGAALSISLLVPAQSPRGDFTLVSLGCRGGVGSIGAVDTAWHRSCHCICPPDPKLQDLQAAALPGHGSWLAEELLSRTACKREHSTQVIWGPSELKHAARSPSARSVAIHLPPRVSTQVRARPPTAAPDPRSFRAKAIRQLLTKRASHSTA